MSKTTVKKGRHVLGKLSRNCDKQAPRNCEAALTWALQRDDDGRLTFSACGEVWNHLKTDIVLGGQCVGDLAALFPRDNLAQRIRATWDAWHLNDMNAGTPEQMAALVRAEADAVELLRSTNSPAGCFYDAAKTKPNWYVAGDYITGEKGAGFYGWACHVLKQAGVYEVPVTPELRASALGGLPADATVYRYGSRWLHRVMPDDVVALVMRDFQDETTATLVADPKEQGEPDRDLIADAGLAVEAVFVPWSKSRKANEKQPSLNWRVTVKCRGRDVLTCDYSAGSAHCPASKNPKFKPRTRDYDEAIRLECEHGKTVKGTGSVVTFYGAPIMPNARDVISSLLLDAGAINESFPDWCANYGYDSDSMKARATYDACLSHAVALRGAVGAHMFEMLQEGNQ